jgi:hypothetical protein
MSIQQLWTEDMLQTVTKLWFEPEWTATRIAQHINVTYDTTITRNSVIGKVHRALGGKAKRVRAVGSGNLVSGPKISAAAAPKHKPMPNSAFRPHRNRPLPHPPVEPLPADDVLVGVTLMDLEDNSCRWVCEPADEPIYCGRPKTGGKPYCAAHAERAKAPPRSSVRVRWNQRPNGLSVQASGGRESPAGRGSCCEGASAA